ncbi:uncharacterized protein LOC129564703 [Sitodiplosis mosellana]|uniref:uncharacterized protein LOC129564703 n=1 Tax=Sitodiplosis mosellana TaxID=263140 RepID=UPI00244434A0|nr:uncharacterized protein LOC129564703 [Sitodiplosis mosellana]
MYHTSYDTEKRQWNGVKTNPSFNSQTSLGSVILNTLLENGLKVAQVCAITGAKTTFNELHTLSICAAKKLQSLGYKKGDVILLFTNNSADVQPLVFAALSLGCPILAEVTVHGAAEICRTLTSIRPKIVICDDKFYPMLKECMISMKIIPDFFIFGNQPADTRPIKYLFENFDDELHFVPAKINAIDDVAFMVCTSGSTGNAKGVPLTHANVLNRMSKMSFMTPDDVMIGFTSVDAISGIRYLISGTLNGSTRIVNQGKFTVERLFELVEKFKITFTSSTMFCVHQMLNHPKIETANLSSMKIFRAGGATMSYKDIQKLNQYLPNGKFAHSLGMTEMAGVVSINLLHANNNCVGQLVDDLEAKIVDDQGERLGVNEIGELCLRDPFLFKGYLGDDESTSKCFDSEGFFKTGDLARFDENNDLFIIDRKKEQFKCLSYHVIPAEIQEFLNQIDGVYDSCVVPIPDPNYDSLPAAVLIKADNSTCTEESIEDAVANNFADHKQLRGGVYFVDSFPKTNTGKLARRSVIEMAQKLYNESKKKAQQN